MKQGKFTVEQIIKILKENEAGVKATELCRKYGMSDATFYNWCAKYTLNFHKNPSVKSEIFKR